MHMIDIHSSLEKLLKKTPLRYVMLYRKSNQYNICEKAEGDDFIIGWYENLMIIKGEIVLI